MGFKTLDKKPPARSTHNICKQNEIAGGFPSGLAFFIGTSIDDKIRLLLRSLHKSEGRPLGPADGAENNHAPGLADAP